MKYTGQHSAALITLGAVMGQLFTLLCIPVLSRLYSPQDFGHFSVFTSVLGLFTTTASLHYELAIPLPRSDRRATLLTLLSLTIVAASAAIMSLALALAGPWLLGLAHAQDLMSVRYWLPVSFLLSGCSTVWMFSAIRYKTHGRNALSRGLQGGVQALFQAGAGLLGVPWVGLVAGQSAGAIAATVPLLSRHAIANRPASPRAAVLRSIGLLKAYRNFPLAAAPSSLINAAANNVPTLLLAAFFGAGVAGLYGLGVRVLQTPLRFIGQAISQVFLGQAASANFDAGLPATTARVYLFLMTFSLYTFIPLSLVARPLFSLGFGAVWIEAGRYVQWLSPWLLLSFVTTPLGMLVAVRQKQRQELLLQIAYLVSICAALAVGTIRSGPAWSLVALGFGGGAFLALKLWWLLGIGGCERRPLLRATARESARALLTCSPLALLLLRDLPAAATCGIAALWMLGAHAYNYRVRGVYAF